ncbi:MAG: molybdenum cofactor biosynthesis protein, partial [Pseudomonadota bacterium]
MAIDPDKTFIPINIAVLTVSDTRTPETDTSGDILALRIDASGHSITTRMIVKDDAALLAAQLEQWI